MKFIKIIINALSEITKLLVIVYLLLWAPIFIKYKPHAILDNNMTPSYKKGSIVYYKKVKEEDLKVGDIITYKIPGKYLTSVRILSIENDIYKVKSDSSKNDLTSDLKYENIKGKNSKVIIHFMGYYLNIVSNNIILFIILSTGIILTSYKLRTKKTPLLDEEDLEEMEKEEII